MLFSHHSVRERLSRDLTKPPCHEMECTLQIYRYLSTYILLYANFDKCYSHVRNYKLYSKKLSNRDEHFSENFSYFYEIQNF